MPIFYVLAAGLIYSLGQLTAPKPTVTIVDNGVVSESKTANSPIVFFRDGDKLEIRGAYNETVFLSAPPEPTVEESRFYKNFFGQWTVVSNEK